MKSREIALTGLMAALTLVVTRAFIIPIPQTKGFFNVGETAIYMAALLFGPRVGALAGGIGSALADLSLGYASFAPFTLVIKGVEGYVVGLLGQRTQTGIVAMVPGALGLLAGVWALTFSSWLVRAAGITVLIAGAGALLLMSRRERARRTGARLAAMIAGGLLMVAGYFVTQAFILGLGVPAALVEVPYNIVQMTTGIVAGLVASAIFEQAILTPQGQAAR
ncbi:MAG: ECF transporter S component [bacterium]